MEFYDVRVGAAIVSSHKTLQQACVVQQKAPSDRRVVLTSLDGTKWCDLREIFRGRVPQGRSGRPCKTF